MKKSGMQRVALFIALALLACSAAGAQSEEVQVSVKSGNKLWSAQTFPNPQRDVQLCGRHGLPSWICDPDGLLHRESADVTEGVIKFILSGQPPYGTRACGDAGPVGYEVAVALAKEIAVPAGLDDAGAAEQFAQELHAIWGVGRAECQNGVLIFFAIANRQMYISVGEGAQERLTHDVLGRIIEQAKVFLRASSYGPAVENTVTNVGLALSGTPIDAPSQGGWLGGLVVFGVIGGFVALAVHGHRQGNRERLRYRDCRVLLERIKRDQAALQSGAYSVSSCPVCLEEFEQEPPDADGAPPSTSTSSSAPAAATSTTAAAGAATSSSAAGAGSSEAAPLLQRQAAPGAGTSINGSGANGGAPSASGMTAAAAAAALRRAGSPGLAAGAAAKAAAAGAGAAGEDAAHVHRRALVVPCGHVFCEPCLTRWMAQQRKLSCPICRRDMDTGEAPPPPPPNTRGPPCNEQVDAWERVFPEAVVPGVMPPAPRLRLVDPHPWLRNRAGQRWRFRGASGYTVNDWSNHYHGNIAPEQIMEMQRMELLFRIQALRRRFPEFVTPGMARTWSNDMHQGRELSAQALRDFQLRDPAVRQELRQAGSSGNSMSFGGGGGGGRSSGGRGGSW